MITHEKILEASGKTPITRKTKDGNYKLSPSYKFLFTPQTKTYSKNMQRRVIEFVTEDEKIPGNNLRKAKILDYGSGLGESAEWAKESGGYKIDTYDVNHGGNTENIKKDYYDIVICDYVLNVVPKLLRARIMLDLKTALRPDGALIITTRTDGAGIIKLFENNWRIYEDGVVSSKTGQFQTTIDQRQLFHISTQVAQAHDGIGGPYIDNMAEESGLYRLDWDSGIAEMLSRSIGSGSYAMIILSK